ELYQSVTLEKERSVAILSNIADGIVAVDREGRVVLWNAAAERITGVPAEEALGRTPAQVLQRDLESDGTGAVAGRIFAFRDISGERILEQMKSDFVSTVSEQLRRPLTLVSGFAET